MSGKTRKKGGETPPANPRARASEGRRWSDEQIDALCALLEHGVPMRAACARIGIPRTSLWEARKVDEELDVRVRDAMCAWEARLVEKIATDEDWKSAAWLLERRRPKAWGPPKTRVEQEVTGRDGAPQEHHVSMDVAGLVRIARAKKESNT